MTHHPIRDLPINVYRAPDDQTGPAWIARLGNGNAFPLIISGDSEQAVRDKATAFVADTIAQHETGYRARIVAMEKARAARMRKAKKRKAE